MCPAARPANWLTRVAQRMPPRSWHNHLCPHVRKDEWSVEEDRLIMDLVQRYGTKWSKIVKMFPGRSDNAIKNRYNSTMRKNQRRLLKESGGEPAGLIRLNPLPAAPTVEAPPPAAAPPMVSGEAASAPPAPPMPPMLPEAKGGPPLNTPQTPTEIATAAAAAAIAAAAAAAAAAASVSLSHIKPNSFAPRPSAISPGSSRSPGASSLSSSLSPRSLSLPSSTPKTSALPKSPGVLKRGQTPLKKVVQAVQAMPAPPVSPTKKVEAVAPSHTAAAPPPQSELSPTAAAANAASAPATTPAAAHKSATRQQQEVRQQMLVEQESTFESTEQLARALDLPTVNNATHDSTSTEGPVARFMTGLENVDEASEGEERWAEAVMVGGAEGDWSMLSFDDTDAARGQLQQLMAEIS